MVVCEFVGKDPGTETPRDDTLERVTKNLSNYALIIS
jgi:hypothetical protein